MSNETKYEIKELKGTMHKSTTKKTDAHPDLFGSCRIEGKVYKISAWENTSSAGNKYFSLAYQEEVKPSDVPATSDNKSIIPA